MKRLLMLWFVGAFSLAVVSPAFATWEYYCINSAEAINGYVTPEDGFTDSLEPNYVYTGYVNLISHLDRPWANYDINPLPNGNIQLMCIYATDDGVQVGGMSRIVTPEDPNLPYACHALENSFWCQSVFN